MKFLKLLFVFFFFVCFVRCSGAFNVMSFGARADGGSDDSPAFEAAWMAACSSKGHVNLLIPRGTYLLGPVRFHGPCRNATSITVLIKGYLKATTNLTKYVDGDHWIEFAWVNNLSLAGGGTFDGQGASSWPYNKCPTNIDCKVLPTSVKFVHTNNTKIQRITSVNSKFFHIAIVGCTKFLGHDIKITAPENSPNTDGIHIDRSSKVKISRSVIRTGDDCISVGQGNSHITITGISCGPGHGISVGSLGRYHNEGNVEGLIVKNCTLSSTKNGVRIKTWANSPGKSTASNIRFENFVMHDVANPIIIDQTYCPYAYCNTTIPSSVMISDIVFKDIRGTSRSPVAVTLNCSEGYPCQNIKLDNVRLRYVGKGNSTARCANVEASYSGTQVPLPCSVDRSVH